MDNKLIDYVVGFLFNEDGTSVVLIRKNRPKWQEGLWNGVGGHIEENEVPLEAMVREFSEEAGLVIENWEKFAVMQGASYRVHFFKAFSDDCVNVKSITDEQVKLIDISSIKSDLVSNLYWLIIMALDMDHSYSTIIMK